MYVLHPVQSMYMYSGLPRVCKAIAEQLGIHGTDEGQTARNSCPLFAWFALRTPFSMYIECNMYIAIIGPLCTSDW